MTGQVAGDGAFARASRPVNGHNNSAGPLGGARRGVVQTHPRFFVPCLAVKPKRDLPRVVVPAARAGLRSPRVLRASARASLRGAAELRLRVVLRPAGPVFPLAGRLVPRLLHAEAEAGLAVLEPFDDLVPLVPFEPCAAWPLPFPLPLLAAFEAEAAVWLPFPLRAAPVP